MKATFQAGLDIRAQYLIALMCEWANLVKNFHTTLNTID